MPSITLLSTGRHDHEQFPAVPGSVTNGTMSRFKFHLDIKYSAGPWFRRIEVHNRCKINVRFEVFTAVTMKNVVFWGIKTKLVPHRRHITSPLQSPAG
jgi:hypothetical protein